MENRGRGLVYFTMTTRLRPPRTQEIALLPGIEQERSAETVMIIKKEYPVGKTFCLRYLLKSPNFITPASITYCPTPRARCRG